MLTHRPWNSLTFNSIHHNFGGCAHHINTCNIFENHASTFIAISSRGQWVNSLRLSDDYICVSKLTTIGLDNGLSPGRRQAIIWTNAGILLMRPLETNISEIVIEIQTFSLKKKHLKVVCEMVAILHQPQCVKVYKHPTNCPQSAHYCMSHIAMCKHVTHVPGGLTRWHRLCYIFRQQMSL